MASMLGFSLTCTFRSLLALALPSFPASSSRLPSVALDDLDDDDHALSIVHL
jgi:hypothetical protein